MKFSLAFAIALLAALATAASADSSRRLLVHEADGTHFLNESAAGAGDLAPPVGGPRDELLWQRTIPGNIYSSCATMDFSVFAGSNNGASCVAEYFTASSTGTPDWIYTGGENLVHARAGLLAVVERVTAINGVRLSVWQAAATPTFLWSKDVPNCNVPAGCLRIADGGTVLALAVNLAASSKIYALDAVSGDLISAFVSPAGQFARTLRISADGSRIALRNGVNLHVLDTSSGLSIWTASAGASSDALAFSPDGRYLASGWTFLLVWEWNGSTYQFRWSNNGGGSNRYMGTCALGANGELIAGWYSSSFNQNRVQWFDASSGTPIWTYVFPQSSGIYQDLPVASAMSGGVGVIGTWGDAEGLNPEISVFLAAQPEPIFTVNTVGSIFDVDAESYAPGERYPARLAGCGKHVHANQFGSGGDLYFADVSPPTAAPTTPAASGIALAAHPNPFNPKSTLSLSLAEPGFLHLEIFSVDGRLRRQLWAGPRGRGEQDFTWDGRDDAGQPLPSGVYLARAEAAGAAATARLVLLR